MTPQEKAKELFDKYFEFDFSEFLNDKECAKKCSIICIDEILKQSMDNEYTEKYWKQVKSEIQIL